MRRPGLATLLALALLAAPATGVAKGGKGQAEKFARAAIKASKDDPPAKRLRRLGRAAMRQVRVAEDARGLALKAAVRQARADLAAVKEDTGSIRWHLADDPVLELSPVVHGQLGTLEIARARLKGAEQRLGEHVLAEPWMRDYVRSFALLD